jgi:hypothetical protein
MSKQYPFDDVTPKGTDVIPSKTIQEQLPTEMEKIKMEQPNVKGVEATVKVIAFIGAGYNATTDALVTDNKISLAEGITIGVSIAPKALEAFKALPEVPGETIFDKLSEEDVAKLVGALDALQNLKGDTRDAVKELLPIINDLKVWGLKYFGKNE